MSQFYAEIQGHRGEASRQGTRKSGIWCHIRGWKIGAFVECFYNAKTGKDIVRVYKTGGSNSASQRKLIATFSDKPRPHTEPSKVCYKSSDKARRTISR